MVTLCRTVVRARPATNPTSPDRAPPDRPSAASGVLTLREAMSTMRPNRRSILGSTVRRVIPLGPRITAYGREHIEHVRRAAGLLVEDVDEADRVGRLLVWSGMSPKRPYSVYVGSAAGYHASKGLDLTHYEFAKAAHFVNYCRSLARKAENMVREDAGLPRVGEGWLSETRLFYELRDAFPEQTVEQHASPEWLGRQHLDVYLPEIAVGVEFQGAQHDGPVDFFGGPEAYEAVQKRDARKLRLCKRHGAVSYTHLRAHETPEHLVCRLLLEKKKSKKDIRRSIIQ